MTGTSGRAGFRLRQKFKAAHSGHVDVGKDQDQRCARRVTDALKGAIRRLGKINREAAGAEVAPELLAKKHLNIRFVVDDENKETHVLGPALRGALDSSLIASAALRHTALSSIRGSKRIL